MKECVTPSHNLHLHTLLWVSVQCACTKLEIWNMRVIQCLINNPTFVKGAYKRPQTMPCAILPIIGDVVSG